MPDSFHIICDEDNMRLDVFLSDKLSLTRTKIKDMLEGGHVQIDGKKPKPSLKTKKSMEIRGEIPDEEPLSLVPEDIPLEILYEDEFFLAVNKPADMVVHPSFGHASGTLVNAILAYLGRGAEGMAHGAESVAQPVYASIRPGIVHRLDKGTTGVILVAKDSRTQETLSHLFKERTITKTYRAIVEGDVKKGQWTMEGNIGRHPIERKKMAVLKTGGRPSETAFKVLKSLKGFTYVEAYPKTGRTHQIRVHLAHGGYPIVGDETYGKKAKTLAPRPLLHAYRIELIHPVKHIPVKIEAPVPADMEKFVEEHSL